MAKPFQRSRKSTGIRVSGLEALLSTFTQLPKETNSELRTRSKRIADDVASDIRGWLGTAQAAPVLENVKATNDRIPTIQLGGSSSGRVSGGATRGELLGANFGASRAKQFPSVKKPDYYVFTTIKMRSRWIFDEWQAAVLDVLAKVDPAVNNGT